jgi:hypothetical protein
MHIGLCQHRVVLQLALSQCLVSLSVSSSPLLSSRAHTWSVTSNDNQLRLSRAKCLQGALVAEGDYGIISNCIF